jgi:hypothetical protein
MRDRDAQRYGVPLIISEFGACTSSQNCMNEINSVVDACDEYLASWAYWQFKTYMDITTSAGDTSEGFYEKDGTLQRNKAEALSRTYIKAAQGVTKSMYFDKKTYDFTGTFLFNSAVKESTQIFLNEDYFYQEGFSIEVTNSNNKKVEFTFDQTIINHINLHIDSSFNEQLLKVVIKPKTIKTITE